MISGMQRPNNPANPSGEEEVKDKETNTAESASSVTSLNMPPAVGHSTLQPAPAGTGLSLPDLSLLLAQQQQQEQSRAAAAAAFPAERPPPERSQGYHFLDSIEGVDLPNYVRMHDSTLSFPEKLMLMLMYMESEYAKAGKKMDEAPIAWTMEGKAFVIRQREPLVEHWFPLFFRHSKFSSFTRKLYRWGFRQVNMPHDIMQQDYRETVYGNMYFQRNNKSLMKNMESFTAASNRRKKQADADKKAKSRQNEGRSFASGKSADSSDEGDSVSGTAAVAADGLSESAIIQNFTSGLLPPGGTARSELNQLLLQTSMSSRNNHPNRQQQQSSAASGGASNQQSQASFSAAQHVAALQQSATSSNNASQNTATNPRQECSFASAQKLAALIANLATSGRCEAQQLPQRQQGTTAAVAGQNQEHFASQLAALTANYQATADPSFRGSQTRDSLAAARQLADLIIHSQQASAAATGQNQVGWSLAAQLAASTGNHRHDSTTSTAGQNSSVGSPNSFLNQGSTFSSPLSLVVAGFAGSAAASSAAQQQQQSIGTAPGPLSSFLAEISGDSGGRTGVSGEVAPYSLAASGNTNYQAPSLQAMLSALAGSGGGSAFGTSDRLTGGGVLAAQGRGVLSHQDHQQATLREAMHLSPLTRGRGNASGGQLSSFQNSVLFSPCQSPQQQYLFSNQQQNLAPAGGAVSMLYSQQPEQEQRGAVTRTPQQQLGLLLQLQQQLEQQQPIIRLAFPPQQQQLQQREGTGDGSVQQPIHSFAQNLNSGVIPQNTTSGQQQQEQQQALVIQGQIGSSSSSDHQYHQEPLIPPPGPSSDGS